MIKVDERFDIDYIDPSSISEANRCMAKYLFSRLMGLRQQDEQYIALDYGTDMHLALPYCYSGIDDVDKAISVFMEAWSNRSYGNSDSKRNVLTAAASLKDFAACHDSLMCSYKKWRPDYSAPTHEKVSDDEIAFLIDTGGELSLAGRMDLAAILRSDDSLWAVDYKTASEISERYFKCFHNSPQAVSYTLALSHISGKICKGLMIEAVRVSKTNVECQTELIHVNEQQVESFIDLANRTALNIMNCNEEKTWPKSCTGCAPYSMFGQPGRLCKYSDICDSADWKTMAKFYVRKEPFHPFKVSK